MPDALSIQSPKTTHRQRYRQVSQVLDTLNVGTQRAGVTYPKDGASPARALCKALDTLGQGFALFGQYLASRADLFSIADCLAFGAIKDAAQPTPLEDLSILFQAQIGRTLHEAYQAFDAEPFDTCMLYQRHRALLPSGREVIVKMLHPDVHHRLNADWPHLEHLEPAWISLGHTRETFAAVLTHFESVLEQQMDFVREKEDLLVLKDDMETSEWCRVPAVYPVLCGPRVLTIEGLGTLLNHTLESATGEDRLAQARSLCAGWLQQVFHGHVFSMAPHLNHLSGLADGSIAFLSGPFSKLTSESRENIWSYLTAASQHDPERACRCLLREMKATSSASDEKTLRHLFRQVVPFRDGGWGNIGIQDSLPEHLFIHWRLAIEHGYRPQPELLAFFRSLFLVGTAVHQLAPDADPFADALTTYQDRLRNDQFQSAFAMGQWSDALDKYAGSFTELPQKIDRLLTRAADGDLTLRFRMQEAAEHRQTRNASSLAISLLLLLAAVVLLVYHLSQSGIGEMWLKQAGAVVFVLIGGLLLWVITRSKSKPK